MNTQNLRDNYPTLIDYMKKSGYSGAYISKVRREIDRILALADSKDWTSYRHIYQEYVDNSSSKPYPDSKLSILGIIERFDIRGEFPDGRTRQKIIERGSYQYLTQEFKRVIDTYREYEERQATKKATTIRKESSNAASFLYQLQCSGISTLKSITPKDISAVFLNDDGTLRRSYGYKNIIATVFKANIPANPELFSQLIGYLPNLRRNRKNIQYLTNEEVVKIKRVLVDSESGLSLRDKAIGMLALCYGLRCCDIAKLTVDDVDLDCDIISILQQKTSEPLKLPLTTSVGNALYDYVDAERRCNSDFNFIFLSENYPFGRLMAGSFTNIAAKIMKAAEIRQNAGDRKGFHIFRHRLTTDLLGNGVAQPIISKIIGHTSPNSLEAYLSTDFVHLKECALSIEQFPIRREVFTNA
jgi:integrase